MAELRPSQVVPTDPATIGTSLRRRRKRYQERVFASLKIRIQPLTRCGAGIGDSTLTFWRFARSVAFSG